MRYILEMAQSDEEWVARHVAEIEARYGQRIGLDGVGEVIGDQVVTPVQIENLFDALEARGISVGEEGTTVATLLHKVLVAARELRSESKAVGPQQIAERTEMTVREVRVALLFADVLQR